MTAESTPSETVSSDTAPESSDAAGPAAPPSATPALQIGRFKLTGVPALLTVLVLLGLLVAAIVDLQPRVSVLISAGIWVAMDVYWTIAQAKRPQAKSAESPESRRRHQQLTTFGLLLLFMPIPGLTRPFVPDNLTTALIGLGVQSGFMLFYFYARFYLGALWSGAIAIMADHRLIQTGPYRFLRHPMYSGMLGMAIGSAIVSGQYHALLGVALFAFAYARKIRIEDRVLAAEFGPDYETYRRRTAALVPWVF